MAFIKNFRAPEDQVGKTFVLIRDCEAIKGTITKGSLVEITEVDPYGRGFSIKDLESGETLIECGFDCVDW